MFRPRVIALLLGLITLLAYLPALHNGFVNYDDETYVTKNPMVQSGLTWAGIQWAFTTFHFSNWHPLTWISYMVDCQLFRLNPAGHHLGNLLLHATNTSLLFVLLWRLTGRLGASAFVAALFAWHPLHVESVAWISERKDVLSMFFGLLALLSYVCYVQSAPGGEASERAATNAVPSRHPAVFYGLSLVFFALSLMSKSMLVTLPFVMLLLDYWPLPRTRTLARCLLEKSPFLLMSAIVSVLTVLAQRTEAMATLAKYSLSLRCGNVVVAYADYLEKTIWPVHLAVFYPLSKTIPWPEIVLAASVLLVISAVVFLGARKQPWLLVGWLWYLGTLVPVIGLVQVGDQALADRYTYFPLIGIFWAVTLAAGEFARRFQRPNQMLAPVAGLILFACLLLTEKQLGYWRDSQTLFTHALAVTKDNALAHLNMGAMYQDRHESARALAEYQEVLRLAPGRHEAYNNISRILSDEGKLTEALEYSRVALQLNPKSPSAHDSLGIILIQLGRFDEAKTEFAEALRLDATYAPAHFQLGRALLKQGRDAEALPPFREALRLEPDNFPMLLQVARVLAGDENPQARNGAEAVVLAQRAAQLAGGEQPVVLDTLAAAYAEAGRFDEAVQTQQRAVELARASGSNDDMPAMQQRLELYQSRQPWRESFRAR